MCSYIRVLMLLTPLYVVLTCHTLNVVHIIMVSRWCAMRRGIFATVTAYYVLLRIMHLDYEVCKVVYALSLPLAMRLHYQNQIPGSHHGKVIHTCGSTKMMISEQRDHSPMICDHYRRSCILSDIILCSIPIFLTPILP